MVAFIKRWKYLGLILLLIALLLLAKSCGGNETVSGAEGAAKEAWSPVAAVGDFFGNIFDFSTKKGLQKELDAANKELAELKTQTEISGDIVAENEELRELLELKRSYSNDWVTVAAEVTAREADNWYEKLTLNKGSKDGITENMAVVNEKGLIGKTVNVTENTCEVLLIIDAGGALGGMLKESSIEGVLQGIGGGKGLISMTKLPYNADIQLNDVVVTSGVGGIFPAGILVGSVVKVTTSSDGLSKEAIIEPYCDFNAISFVLIVHPMTEEEIAARDKKTAEDDAETSDAEDDDGDDGTAQTKTNSTAEDDEEDVSEEDDSE